MSVSCCAVLDSILAGGAGDYERPAPLVGLAIGVIEGYVDESLDASVAAAFADALARLGKAGAKLTRLRLPELAELPHIHRNGTLVEFEAFAVHRGRLETSAAQYDPWVLARLEASRGKSAADYIDLLNDRARVRAAIETRTRDFDALALPTVPIAPPALGELGDLAASRALNALILRNAAIANFLDRPAISIPCHPPGRAPAGFMLMGGSGLDRRLMAAARGAEEAVRAHS
jgi:aspartyl-tRNA(Asn)/glutamyl-tRNA(Gln) amidotransferase subunit A